MTDPYIDLAITHLAKILGCHPDDLSEEDTLSSVKKWDSLNHMRLVLQLEEELNRQVDTEEIMTLFSVEGIAELLRKNAPSL